MFTILGVDGKEYGPIPAGQLRQWIVEGRAGGSTQAKRAEDPHWAPLHSLPEFADVFQAPPPLCHGALAGALPPGVRLFALGFFIAAAISAMFMLFSVFTIMRYALDGTFHPGASYFISSGFGLLGLPIRIVCGIGLLRGREWARKLAVIFAAIMVMLGAWVLIRTYGTLARTTDFGPILRSLSFLLSHLWSVAILAFNIATVVVLNRRPVRAAFAEK